MEIDHIFRVVQSNEQALSLISKLGFDVTKSKTTDHTNQGTSGRFIFFEKNYIEFLWLRDENEAATSELRLDKRFKSALSGISSPFGICFRDQNFRLSDSFKHYKPSYGKYELSMFKESLVNFNIPELFFLKLNENPTMKDYYPVNFGEAFDGFITQSDELSEFKEIELVVPASKINDYQIVSESFDRIKISEGREFGLKINGSFSF